ncbi:MAG TPA: hypothetical protein VIV11_15870 [Kofleriaceae bacterium]
MRVVRAAPPPWPRPSRVARHTRWTGQRRTPSSSHAVETARALKERGFDKRQIKVAMDKTRTHVGTAELSSKQWLEIAIGYCGGKTTG